MADAAEIEAITNEMKGIELSNGHPPTLLDGLLKRVPRFWGAHGKKVTIAANTGGWAFVYWGVRTLTPESVTA